MLSKAPTASCNIDINNLCQWYKGLVMLSRRLLHIRIFCSCIFLAMWLLTLQSSFSSSEQRNTNCLWQNLLGRYVDFLPLNFSATITGKPSSSDTVFGCSLSAFPWCSSGRHYSYSKHFCFSLPLVRYVRRKPLFSFCSGFLSGIIPYEALEGRGKYTCVGFKLYNTSFLEAVAFSCCRTKELLFFYNFVLNEVSVPEMILDYCLASFLK